MVVRIRITRPSRRGPQVQDFAAGVSGLLTLTAVVCTIMAAWKLMADMGQAGGFVLATGPFSHWQVWLASGIVAQLLSFRITRRRPLIS